MLPFMSSTMDTGKLTVSPLSPSIGVVMMFMSAGSAHEPSTTSPKSPGFSGSLTVTVVGWSGNTTLRTSPHESRLRSMLSQLM